MDDTTRGLDDAGAARHVPPALGASSPGRSTSKSKPPSAQDTGLDRDTDIRTRKLQAEIAETRDELSETVEAIQEKLRPSNLMSEGTEAVKTAATERVRDMADNATETASRMVASTRQNPWPALMIGTGLAWLLLDRTRETQRSEPGNYRSRRYPASGYGMVSDRVRTRAYSDDDEWSGDGALGPGRQYGRGRGDSHRSVGTTPKQVQTAFQRMLRENPLLVAAGAVLIGAAVGGALPQTEKENELMGEARDQVVERAQDAAREAADSVKEVASAVQQAATQVDHTAG